MAIRVLRLGSDRMKDEGLRIGTVRRPPRGVRKEDYGKLNYYDVWLPNLSPSPDTMKLGKSAKTDKAWVAFKKKYRAEMKALDAARVLELLAAISHQLNLSVGCYCEDQDHCHRSVLKALLIEKGAEVIS